MLELSSFERLRRARRDVTVPIVVGVGIVEVAGIDGQDRCVCVDADVVAGLDRDAGREGVEPGAGRRLRGALSDDRDAGVIGQIRAGVVRPTLSLIVVGIVTPGWKLQLVITPLYGALYHGLLLTVWM